jgi:tRNA(Ile)-lysidine synthase
MAEYLLFDPDMDSDLRQTGAPESAAGRPPSDPLLAAVHRSVLQHGWARPGLHLLAAVSGGADSVALLHALLALAPEFSWQLSIAHLNHGLRGAAAEKDAAFVTAMAQDLGLPCRLGCVSVPEFRRQRRLSIEEAARLLRYAFLDQAAGQTGAQRVALGHTADDNAELILMRLLRGSGPLGLAGIAPQRGGLFIRPLLAVTRGQVLDFLRARRLAWVEDSSNRDTRFLRNRVRHCLLPELERSYNPGVRQALLRLAAINRADEAYLEACAQPPYQEARVAIRDGIGLRLTVLASLPAALAHRLIRRAIAEVKGDLRGIGQRHVLAVAGLPAAAPRQPELHLPGPLRVVCSAQALCFSLPPRAAGGRPLPDAAPQADFALELPAPGCYRAAAAGVRVSIEALPPERWPGPNTTGHMEAFFDMDEVAFPLVLRRLRPGDRFTPLGLQGRQKIRKFLIDHKVPRRERPGCIVLASGGADPERVIWLVGQRIDASARVRSGTARLLRVRLETLPDPPR